MPNINRVNWTYVGDKTNTCLVELKHFRDSGNLAIFCNGQIVITDFEVFGEAEYSFFIGEELCRIFVKTHPNGERSYEFKIVDDIDTPLNRRRKKLSRRHLIQSLLVIFGVMLLLGGLMGGGYWAYQTQLAKDLRENGITKPVQINIQSHVDKGKFYNAYYVFYYQNKKQAGHFKLPKNQRDELVTPNGFPLQNKDEFLLTFSSKHIDNFRLDFHAPSENQIKKYRSRTLQMMSTDSLEIPYNNCLLNAVYQVKGLSGWANVYHKNISRKENENHHHNSYEKMMQEEKIKKLIMNCKKR